MDRRNFLKKLGIGLGAAAAATVPSIAKERKEEYTIEDMFIQHDGNGDLFYLKEGCWLDDEIKKMLDNVAEFKGMLEEFQKKLEQ